MRSVTSHSPLAGQVARVPGKRDYMLLQKCFVNVFFWPTVPRDGCATWNCTEPIFHIEWGYGLLGHHHD
jgi:hypothetical protein